MEEAKMTHLSKENLGFWLTIAGRYVAYGFGQALEDVCREHGKPYTITSPQWNVLATLNNQNGSTISAISQYLGSDMPTITGIVQRLEQHGLVKRKHDQADRRVVTVWLTDEGIDLMRFLPEATERMLEPINAGLTEEEIDFMITAIQNIVQRIAAHSPNRELTLPDHFFQRI
jgi:MarR family transcriptional regulator, organic hydroperoxide resistance regulator